MLPPVPVTMQTFPESLFDIVFPRLALVIRPQNDIYTLREQ